MSLSLGLHLGLRKRARNIPPSIPKHANIKTVVFDFPNNWGSGTAMSIMAVEFKLNGTLHALTESDFTAYATSSYDASALPKFSFDTSLEKAPSLGPNNNRWLSGSSQASNQRLIVVFNTPIDFDEIVVNNYHNLGTDTTWGVRDTVITVTENTYSDTTYNAAVTNGVVVFDGVTPEHKSVNAIDDFSMPISLPGATAAHTNVKTVVFDFADNWGDVSYMALRSIEFKLDNVLYGILASDFTAYSTTDFGSPLEVENVFDTSLSKIGSSDNNGWYSASSQNKDQRVIVVLNTPIDLDEIVFNNFHSSGGSTNRGVKNTIITAVETEYTNTAYRAAISGGKTLFSDVIPQHVASDVADDYTVPIILA